MRLLPFDKFTIETDKPKIMVYQILLKNTEIKKNYFDMPYKDKSFYGKVWYEGFDLIPNIKYRNPFIPIIKGKILEDDDVTKIIVTTRLCAFTMLFFTLWISACISLFIAVLSGFAPFIIIPILMASTFYVVMFFGYKSEVSKIKKKFTEMFDLSSDDLKR